MHGVRVSWGRAEVWVLSCEGGGEHRVARWGPRTRRSSKRNLCRLGEMTTEGLWWPEVQAEDRGLWDAGLSVREEVAPGEVQAEAGATPSPAGEAVGQVGALGSLPGKGWSATLLWWLWGSFLACEFLPLFKSSALVTE